MSTDLGGGSQYIQLGAYLWAHQDPVDILEPVGTRVALSQSVGHKNQEQEEKQKRNPKH